MKISDFKAPFGDLPALRLNVVPRWAIMNMSKQQTVAEHSFNTAIIVLHLCKLEGITNGTANELMREALLHDLPEIYTGDIPSPAKVESAEMVSHPIVKLADALEAYRFFSNYHEESAEVEEWVLEGLKKGILLTVSELTKVKMNDLWPIMNGEV